MAHVVNEKLEVIDTLEKRDDFKHFVKINKYVIVKFSATWCNPCQRIKEPFINFYKDSLKYNKEIKLILVDIDENREIPNLVRIKSVPTMIFYCSGDMENSCNSSAIENVKRFFETSLQNIKKNENSKEYMLDMDD
jgi:thiol-disulfide isomerase/thioredoxin